MTLTQWEDLSGHAIGAAGILYFVALCCHLAEVAALAGTKVKKNQEAVLADVSTGTAEQSVTWVDGDAEREEKREFRREFIGRLGLILTLFAVLAHGVALLARGMAAERVPWGNMYEFTLAGTFVVALAYLVLYKKFKLGWMAPLVIGLVVALIMVGQIWLYAPVAPLSESLNSYWLVIHVVSAIIATGAFTLGGIASIMYLIKLKTGERETGWLARVPSLPQLDRVAYRIHAFAFPVWTFAVLITGPIWAHEAWSSYWSWDPKEVWAFITWVVYAGYLHARATAGWKGRNAAILALVGMATLWFNFIGINYFSTSSQHSYADSAISAPADISTTQLTGAIDQ